MLLATVNDSTFVSTDVFLVAYHRSPFAGVVRTCYPLSMAFDGRLMERNFLTPYTSKIPKD